MSQDETIIEMDDCQECNSVAPIHCLTYVRYRQVTRRICDRCRIDLVDRRGHSRVRKSFIEEAEALKGHAWAGPDNQWRTASKEA